MYWAIYCRSNLMMYADDTALIRRLTKEGRRLSRQVAVAA